MGIVQPRLVQVDERRADAQGGPVPGPALEKRMSACRRLVQRIGVATPEGKDGWDAAALEGPEVSPGWVISHAGRG